MASRRDQLDAYVFARRRIVAAFLRPGPRGSDEDAPRALRTFMPGLVVGALVMAGFGVYGMIRPGTPPGWKDPGSLIVGRDSASRYVYLDGHLHPVLNVASGRLLLDPSTFKVNTVPESVLNSVAPGPPLGIPDAPDRLPSVSDVRKAKAWTVCERSGTKPDGSIDPGSQPQRSVFVGDTGLEQPRQPDRLGPADALFVQSASGTAYLVTSDGSRFPVKDSAVRSQLGLDTVTPEPVSDAWLATLHEGPELVAPPLDGYGQAVPSLDLAPRLNHVGVVVRVDGVTQQDYVVTKNGVEPVSHLMAQLLLADRLARLAYQGQSPTEIPVGISDLGDTVQQGTELGQDNGWPQDVPKVVDVPDPHDPSGGRLVLCTTFTGAWINGQPQVYTSAAGQPPAQLVDGMGGVYVKPGSGALYRETTGAPGDDSGPVYLLTDSGLRYLIPNDPTQNGATPDPNADSDAKVRLGYKGVTAQDVPRAFSGLVPVGPALDPAQARRPQGS